MNNPRSVVSVIAGATLLQVANGLLQALLPLRMQLVGLSTSQIGLVASLYGLGFGLGCLLAPGFVRRVGHIRAFASLAAILSCIALGFTQASGVAGWAVLRALTGLGLAGLFTVIESWISARATTEARGRVLSIYMVSTKLALVLAPLAIVFGEIGGSGLFMAISIFASLSLLPVAALLSEPPPAPRIVRLGLPQLYALAPSAVAGCVVIGLLTGPVIALAPIYGIGVGLTADQAGVLLLALQGGSLALQWPLGWLSDSMDRRKVIAGMALGIAAISAMIAFLGGKVPAPITFAMIAMWGALALSAYAICIAHACDLVPPERMVPTISGLLICWAAGSMLGPLPSAGAMDLVGPNGLFVYAGLVSLALTSFIAFRVRRQPREAPKGGFVHLSPTSPASASLSPRSGDEAKGRAA